MRRILIVGAGQSGLQLGLCLLQHDYDVTIMTARTATELASGRAVSVQLLTSDQVDLEQVGSETIEGLATTKYKFVMKDGSAGGFLWYTREGIPVKMDLISKSGGRNSRITVTLENVQVGEQDPSLFELPAGYTALPGGMINMRR